MALPAANLDHNEWQSWHAHLYLDFDRTDRGTRLSGVDHNGPLYVQRPFYPEGPDCAHVYLLHPPGGIVSGDLLDIQLRLAPGAQVLATTPGAGRAYGARQNHTRQRQINTLDVTEGAVVEWFPMENIVYSGADLDARTKVNLQPGGKFIGWEINCLGLPASNQPFAKGSLTQHFQLDLGGVPSFVDQVRLIADDELFLNTKAGMAGQRVSGSFLAGPFASTSELRQVAEEAYSLSEAQGLSLTCLDKFLVARYLGPSAFAARQFFVSIWNVARPKMLNRPSCAPRIWAT